MHNVVWASDAAREWRRRGPSLTVHGAYRRMSACLQLIGSDFQVHLMFHCVINVCVCRCVGVSVCRCVGGCVRAGVSQKENEATLQRSRSAFSSEQCCNRLCVRREIVFWCKGLQVRLDFSPHTPNTPCQVWHCMPGTFPALSFRPFHW